MKLTDALAVLQTALMEYGDRELTDGNHAYAPYLPVTSVSLRPDPYTMDGERRLTLWVHTEAAARTT